MMWENEKIANERIKSFVERLKRIGIEIKLSGNYPWIYVTEINGRHVTETFCGNHGFTLCFMPVKKDREFHFTDIGEIFNLVRKYTA